MSDQKSHSEYTCAVDMWGVGCIYGEMWKRRPLLPGKNEMDQLKRIIDLVGSPSEREWPEHKDYFIFKSGQADSFKKSLATLSDLFPSSQYSLFYVRYQQETWSLLTKLLTLNPKKRPTASEALQHVYFKYFPKPTRLGAEYYLI
jgi:serine/threonine protein kinase